MKRGREIPAPFFLAEIENQAPVELPQRRIAHAEAGAHVFGEQFDGGPVGDGIGVGQLLHRLYQQTLSVYVARIRRALSALVS